MQLEIMDQLERHPFAPIPVPRWYAALAFTVHLPYYLTTGFPSRVAISLTPLIAAIGIVLAEIQIKHE